MQEEGIFDRFNDVWLPRATVRYPFATAGRPALSLGMYRCDERDIFNSYRYATSVEISGSVVTKFRTTFMFMKGLNQMRESVKTRIVANSQGDIHEVVH